MNVPTTPVMMRGFMCAPLILSRLDGQQQRSAEIFRRPGNLLCQRVVTTELAHHELAESGGVDEVQVVGNRVSHRAETIFGSLVLEVRLDARRRHFRMEHRKDETPSRCEARE